MFRQFVAPIESVVESATLPRSLRSVADVRAARTKEKIGHSGRDDRKLQEKEGPTLRKRREG